MDCFRCSLDCRVSPLLRTAQSKSVGALAVVGRSSRSRLPLVLHSLSLCCSAETANRVYSTVNVSRNWPQRPRRSLLFLRIKQLGILDCR